MSYSTCLDVWLKFGNPDDEEASWEANTYQDGTCFRVDWSNTSVGLVSSKTFDTYSEAAAWLTSEGFLDFSS